MTLSLFDRVGLRSPDLQAEIDRPAKAGQEKRGAVFTRPQVVEFILDLADYTSERDLAQSRVLEPSFGTGSFLLEILDRLFDSYLAHGGTPDNAVPELSDSLRAVELHRKTFMLTRLKVIDKLVERGVYQDDAVELVHSWLVNDDFLLTALPDKFTHIVGNPPYVRQESIPSLLLHEYRLRYGALYDRADLYVPFIERSLYLLGPEGKLAFICSNRWMKNRYGGPLRKIIAKHFHLQYYVDMVGTAAFQSDVTVYPAIVVITPKRHSVTRIARRPAVDTFSLRNLADAMQDHKELLDPRVKELTGVANGSEPWILDAPDELVLLRRLEKEFLPLEKAGCKVGIGVATGCDSVFIAHIDQLPIEKDRKLPLVMAPDIRTGRIVWSGQAVINPFKKNGDLVSLDDYPKLAAYLALYQEQIKQRNVARKNPAKWYRTIDRIYESLTCKPKLLIPDIKGAPTVAYDKGHYYPHHNLYHVTSTQWDLEALQAILRSSVAGFFVRMYSVKMRGGYLRFQAQYIRRIRLPHWNSIPLALRERLRVAARCSDVDECNRAVFELYRLNTTERNLILKTYASPQIG